MSASGCAHVVRLTVAVFGRRYEHWVLHSHVYASGCDARLLKGEMQVEFLPGETVTLMISPAEHWSATLDVK